MAGQCCHDLCASYIPGLPGILTARDDRAEDMAWFVVVAGLTPGEYRNLTIRERAAIIRAVKDYHRGR